MGRLFVLIKNTDTLQILLGCLKISGLGISNTNGTKEATKSTIFYNISLLVLHVTALIYCIKDGNLIPNCR